MQTFKYKQKDKTQMLVEFHLKMLYSVHKNKKAPAYMLKSILISLDKMEFNRLLPEYRNRALEIIKLLKPNCYQIMIDIFALKNEVDFFIQLVATKMSE